MKRWGAIGLLVALGVSGFASQGGGSSQPLQETSSSWKTLFDGRDLKGWQAHATFSAPATGDWTVKDGSIFCPGTTSGWLATDDAFSNFELKLQFRGAAKVNSGVFLRSSLEGAPHKTGYELQIWDYQPDGYNSGSLVGSLKAKAGKIIPDAWNQYDIVAQGDHFTVTLNGSVLLDDHDSKHASGHIGFQCGVGSPIEFRNIEVRALK